MTALPRPKDDIPTTFTVDGYSDQINTTNMEINTDEPVIGTCGGTTIGQGQATVWYKYKPDNSTAISIDTTGADYDTFIAVWEGHPDNGILVACNDNGTGQAVLALQVTGNTTYYIEVGQP